ncbi:trihelix transcription factor ASIL1-like [Heracleum sosnowskyi]|uniref:Trihelix transcription factor ASIL1-like n=1 Tax=Heracleum sosnowskyi TaxID=360622 RepID=A0AAD8N638_9APIA|nr:trihelix transcription factor ASIL1-like [Heracleum sosnowskyi]
MTTSHRSFHRPLPSWTALSASRRSFTGKTPLPITAGDMNKPPISSSTKLDPTRDIIWSIEATKTLIETWGDKYKELNRGSLKQTHWQQVTDVVNLRHAGEFLCTDVQVKNRIDTVKKKYKKEKIRVLESAGKYVSKWPFFDFLDFLIGSPAPEEETGIPTCRRGRKMSFPANLEIPVGRRSKRSAPESEVFSGDRDVGRRKFEAMAEVAAKIMEEEEGEGGEGEIGKVAEAIEKFGERYERIEREKMDRMIELEKHKMKLAIDLNVQIMNYVSELRMKVDRNEEAGVVDNAKVPCGC